MKDDVLFSLIQAMSRNERRYFKIFCKKWSTDPNYLLLFNVISKQKIYDEKQINSRFKDKRFIDQLHVTKNYLRKLILKSLRNFHSEQSVLSRSCANLQNIEILYHKELYSYGWSEVNKAIHEAKKHEKLTTLIELYNWKRKLAQIINPGDYKLLYEAVSDQSAYIEQLKNLNQYWKIALDISSMSPDALDFTQLQKARLGNLKFTETLEAKVLFFHSHYLLQLRSGEPEKAEDHLWRLVEFLEDSQGQILEDPGPYVSTINNLISYLVFQKRYEKALHLINRAKSVYQKWKIAYENRSLVRQILRTYNVELEIYRDTGSYAQHEKFIKETEAFISRNKKKIPDIYLFSFWFQLAYIYFQCGDFKTSLHWVNQMLDIRNKRIRPDLQLHARMLNLMVHFEHDNLFVLRYFVDSTRRFLKKSKTIQPFEMILLRFFSHIGRTPKMDHKEKFRDLYQSLFPVGNESLVPSDILDYINYKNWIETKLS